MNQYVKNLDRIEFVVTLACTGRCKHCSEGDHSGAGEHIDGDVAARAVLRISERYKITSLMTFGGEPLLYPETVYKIHSAAKASGIQKRTLITNGFFSRDEARISEVARKLCESGVNVILLSVDAFHQETVPLEPVKNFAKAVLRTGVRLCAHPAWLVSEEDDNPYNRRTREILAEFEAMGVPCSEGNVIFPAGNALKYLCEYFYPSKEYVNCYEEDPTDIRTVSFDPDGTALGGNVYEEDVLDILERYSPSKVFE